MLNIQDYKIENKKNYTKCFYMYCYLWFLSLVSLFLEDATLQHVFCLW